mmetsp:Transcript_17152/g.19497  ORF Transcript_17152/g.19497 Transcript_17152/m.19497 type:complete len:255 (-) Transcript_17152:197-961(-)
MAQKYRCATLQSKGRKDWTIPLKCRRSKAKYTLGRDNACSFILSDMHISSKHVTIALQKNENSSISFEILDSSSNGTWLNGVKLRRGDPVVLLDGYEVSLPCDEHLSEDYTFIVNIPESQTAQEICSVMEAKDRRQWITVEKNGNSLITSISRLAASIYSLSEAILIGSPSEQEICEEKDPVLTAAEIEVSEEMENINLFKKNTDKILQLMLDTISDSRLKVLESKSINAKEREEIIKSLDLKKWKSVVEEYKS